MHILNDPAIQEAKKVALTDSSAKKVTKWLYNLPAPLLLSAVKVKQLCGSENAKHHGIVEESLLKSRNKGL